MRTTRTPYYSVGTSVICKYHKTIYICKILDMDKHNQTYTLQNAKGQVFKMNKHKTMLYYPDADFTVLLG